MFSSISTWPRTSFTFYQYSTIHSWHIRSSLWSKLFTRPWMLPNLCPKAELLGSNARQIGSSQAEYTVCPRRWWSKRKLPSHLSVLRQYDDLQMMGTAIMSGDSGQWSPFWATPLNFGGSQIRTVTRVRQEISTHLLGTRSICAGQVSTQQFSRPGGKGLRSVSIYKGLERLKMSQQNLHLRFCTVSNLLLLLFLFQCLCAWRQIHSLVTQIRVISLLYYHTCKPA